MNKELLHTKVVREIISLVASGAYKDGQRLPAERKLCEQFAVSRGTVRQGLGDLAKLGIIVIKHGSGAYVQKFSHKKLPCSLLPPDFDSVCLRDIITARKAIELTAVELACDRITKEKISILDKLIDNMAESKDNLPGLVKFDIGFHESIVRASGNMVLVTAFAAISEYHKYSQVFTRLHKGQEQTAIEHHRKVLNALRKRDKKLSRKALSAHLDYMMRKCSGAASHKKS